ncbi:hypothetical protein M2158_009529 [Streptomyces sp. SAI-144]|nr:hypothetical protein [Streptomyces sp. SAI-144]
MTCASTSSSPLDGRTPSARPPKDAPAKVTVAVLWLPEHAPTATGSHPMLP